MHERTASTSLPRMASFLEIFIKFCPLETPGTLLCLWVQWQLRKLFAALGSPRTYCSHLGWSFPAALRCLWAHCVGESQHGRPFEVGALPGLQGFPPWLQRQWKVSCSHCRLMGRPGWREWLKLPRREDS